MTFSLRAFIKTHLTEQKTRSVNTDELFNQFMRDLRRMEPTWKAWRLTSAYGINIQRETGELIRLFRMLDEGLWNVYVFVKVVNIQYRVRTHNMLTLKEAIMLVQKYIREIDEKNLIVNRTVTS